MSRPIHPELRASWWLHEGRVGGSARPGFGLVPWRELGDEEAALLTWLGSRDGDAAELAGLGAFFDEYVERRAALGAVGTAAFREGLEDLLEPERLSSGLRALARRTGVSATVVGGCVRMEVTRTAEEARRLREAGIEVLVSLMERAPDAAVAEAGLEVHHLAIEDMSPPRRDQVDRLAELLGSCGRDGRAVVVHCLAGIGRTTTMLAGAELLRGASLESLAPRLARANPSFRQVGPQWRFLQALAGGARACRSASEPPRG